MTALPKVVGSATSLAQGWDREAYEQLFAEAVQYEPTWYEYYTNKVVYLLPRWHGQPGEMQTYVALKDDPNLQVWDNIPAPTFPN